MTSSSRVKKQVRLWLAAPAPVDPAELDSLPRRPVITALLGALAEPEPGAKFRAVEALGRVVARLAQENPQRAREIMKRLAWGLNEESGAVGFGLPEAMGEIMARHQELAHQFVNLLISYLDPAGNYLDFPPLQKGVVWALGRVARTWPGLAGWLRVAPLLYRLLDSDDAELRGLAAWTLAALEPAPSAAWRRRIAGDRAPLAIFHQGRLVPTTVAQAPELG